MNCDVGEATEGFENELLYICTFLLMSGAKGDWDFRISDLVKNPYGSDI